MTFAKEGVCAGHCSPFEYLKAAYFEPGRDLVVWAPRGGGKTRLGAVATLLDLLHKPGVQVRILGGSMDQSLKMWEYLGPDLERVGYEELVKAMRGRNVALANRSRAGVIPQSQRAVRGMRIHKLRCDEVELFDPEVWEAAQLTVRSEVLAGAAEISDEGLEIKPPRTDVRGTIEAMSTFHKPWGLMSKVLERAQKHGRAKVTRWCVLEVLERCPPQRECGTCPLWDDCRGVAKTGCDGFYSIDDAIAMKQRVSEDCWKAEMLCQRPEQKGRVFPAFSRGVHVIEERLEVGGQRLEGPGGEHAPGGARSSGGAGAFSSPTSNLYPPTSAPELSWAIDFGFKAPFVCLWIVAEEAGGRVFVVDEYVRPERTVAEHLVEMEGRVGRWGRPAWVGCDPAGAARNEQTAESNVGLLRKRGYVVRSRPSHIADGIELVRAALKPAHGAARLFVSSRCGKLIKALEGYHYGPGGGEMPEKDGEHDHLIDALR
jgi:hypothetical protein